VSIHGFFLSLSGLRFWAASNVWDADYCYRCALCLSVSLSVRRLNSASLCGGHSVQPLPNHFDLLYGIRLPMHDLILRSAIRKNVPNRLSLQHCNCSQWLLWVHSIYGWVMSCVICFLLTCYQVLCAFRWRGTYRPIPMWGETSVANSLLWQCNWTWTV